MNRISSYQLGSMIILFLIGSSSLFLLASEAGKDAWLSIFLGMLLGLVLLWGVNLTLYRIAPGKNLIEIIFIYLGRPIGYLLSVSYILYFCYKSIRNVREVGDLSIMFLLPNTPLYAINLIICAVAAYTVFRGIGAFFRMAEFILPFVLFIYVSLITMLAITGVFHFERLLPVLDEGIKPLWDAAFPELISFPFGEMILFLMFWKYSVDEKNSVTRTAVICYLISGLAIMTVNMLTLTGLGHLATILLIPFMQLTNLISIGQFLERIDPLVALLLFSGVFFKLTAYYFGAVIGLQAMIKLPAKYIILLIGLLIFIGSLQFKSYMEQVYVGFQFNLKYHFPLFQIAIPAVLLVIVAIRKKIKERAQ